MAASKLSIYQGAALACKERAPTALHSADADKDELERLLDGVWDRRGLDTCLQMGQWNFAKRGGAIEYDPGIDTSDLGGWTYAFAIPDDFVRLVSFCSDPFFRLPTTSYEVASGYWWANFSPVYVQWISNSTDYGLDYSLWPPNFERFVEHYFAAQIINKLTADKDLREDVKRDYAYWMSQAKNTDAMEQPAKFPPPGSWATARGGSRRRGDRGNTGSLTG